MRELNAKELSFVSGAGDECPDDSGNDIVGVKDSENFGRDLINIYEGLIEAASHVIERVANAF